MTVWLKKKHPQPGPDAPLHVDHAEILAQTSERRAMGLNTPALAYLWAMIPAMEYDNWGEELPLSSMQQDALDRLVASLASPYDRGQALLHAGQLAPDEVNALSSAFPELYGLICELAQKDMIAAELPFPAWAEAQISILFRRPAAVVYSGTSDTDDETGGASSKVGAPIVTQAERREIAVREKRP